MRARRPRADEGADMMIVDPNLAHLRMPVDSLPLGNKLSL